MSAPTAYRVAASNTYLEAAALDILGSNERVLRLAEPGMCPGHFDIRPSQINRLRHCRVLLRFDFQKSLDSKLHSQVNDGLRIHEIRIQDGLCVPTSYLESLRQIADLLVADQLIERVTAQKRLTVAEKRIAATGEFCRHQIDKAGWTHRAILCSRHQQPFCQWLGLQVAATFSGADSATVGQIEKAIRAGHIASVDAVIANRPQGQQLADVLAERLNTSVVVFDNFPMMQADGPAFDAMLTSNVQALIGTTQH